MVELVIYPFDKAQSSSKGDGCGKSTLFRMITGEAGCGTIVGQGMELGTSHFVRQVGIISQHPFLFNDTSPTLISVWV